LWGNLILKPLVGAIRIIEEMCSNTYNNSGDRRIMKRDANQVGIDES